MRPLIDALSNPPRNGLFWRASKVMVSAKEIFLRPEPVPRFKAPGAIQGEFRPAIAETVPPELP
jgi:hypothetical protein